MEPVNSSLFSAYIIDLLFTELPPPEEVKEGGEGEKKEGEEGEEKEGEGEEGEGEKADLEKEDTKVRL